MSEFQWFVADSHGNQTGPFALDILRSMVTEGKLPSNAHVWRAGLKEWQPIQTVLFGPASSKPTSTTKYFFWWPLGALFTLSGVSYCFRYGPLGILLLICAAVLFFKIPTPKLGNAFARIGLVIVVWVIFGSFTQAPSPSSIKSVETYDSDLAKPEVCTGGIFDDEVPVLNGRALITNNLHSAEKLGRLTNWALEEAWDIAQQCPSVSTLSIKFIQGNLVDRYGNAQPNTEYIIEIDLAQARKYKTKYHYSEDDINKIFMGTRINQSPIGRFLNE